MYNETDKINQIELYLQGSKKFLKNTVNPAEVGDYVQYLLGVYNINAFQSERSATNIPKGLEDFYNEFKAIIKGTSKHISLSVAEVCNLINLFLNG